MNKELNLNPNPVVAYLKKPSYEFTKADIIRYILTQIVMKNTL